MAKKCRKMLSLLLVLSMVLSLLGVSAFADEVSEPDTSETVQTEPNDAGAAGEELTGSGKEDADPEKTDEKDADPGKTDVENTDVQDADSENTDAKDTDVQGTDLGTEGVEKIELPADGNIAAPAAAKPKGFTVKVNYNANYPDGTTKVVSSQSAIGSTGQTVTVTLAFP